ARRAIALLSRGRGFHVKQWSERPAELGDERLRLLGELIAASPHNLVSRRDREDVLGRHIRECVTLAEVLPVNPGEEWIDVGTGGGLPGLVLAMRHPESRWVLLDATRKKVEAVRSFIGALGVTVECRHGRAEEIAHEIGMRGRFAGAVSRALGPLPIVLELSRGFVRPDGLVAAVRGRQWASELEASAEAARLLRLREPHTLELPTRVREARVVTMRADGPPPVGYPRSDGVPRSRPLGGHTR
ncbi:MAG: 16S rRNA (guanine(527)-N(7))-methyltransferase RsmG, partial [Egibacteraceae bacterium]